MSLRSRERLVYERLWPPTAIILLTKASPLLVDQGYHTSRAGEEDKWQAPRPICFMQLYFVRSCRCRDSASIVVGDIYGVRGDSGTSFPVLEMNLPQRLVCVPDFQPPRALNTAAQHVVIVVQSVCVTVCCDGPFSDDILLHNVVEEVDFDCTCD